MKRKRGNKKQHNTNGEGKRTKKRIKEESKSRTNTIIRGNREEK
jgi:hypothetical protein